MVEKKKKKDRKDMRQVSEEKTYRWDEQLKECFQIRRTREREKYKHKDEDKEGDRSRMIQKARDK